MEQSGTTVSVRISIDLDRLEQEVRVIRHVHDDPEESGIAGLVQRLRYLAASANRLADRLERSG
ncbi:MAG TPA: hypothetical protein VM689_14220 [Aliidongia sp.]|nr:hypothetical protein [Aliidongia sp.]